MIEVIGPDGRTHVFAEGTTEAQIDAALEALYPTSATTPPPVQPVVVPIAPPPPQPQLASDQYNGDPTYTRAPEVAPPRGLSTNQILGGGLVAALVTLAVVAAFMMGRGGQGKAPENAAVTNTVTPPVQDPSLVPVDPNAPTTPTVTAEAFAGFIATKQGGNLNVRSQPQQNGAVLTKLPHGSPVSVTGSVMMTDGLWRQVNVGGAVGFIKGEYVSQTQPPPIAQPVKAAPLVQVGAWGSVNTLKSDTVNMRASPSLNGRVMSSIPYGEEVWIISRQGDWYLVEWGGKRGWASTRFINR
jgi:uncharacterized protein YraI